VIDKTNDWLSGETARTGIVGLADKKNIISLHVVVIVAFDSTNSSIKFANSMGIQWGVNGFGSMSQQVALREIKDMWAIEVPPTR
jgi:hypothetical protein